jgi:hypothetical protein
MRLRRFCALASICAVSILSAMGAAAAQQSGSTAPIYTVEVIVFRASGSLGGAEEWAVEGRRASAPGEDDTAAPNAAAANTGRLLAGLPVADFKLREVEARLRASGGYTPIAHAAWRQTASPWGSKVGFPLDKLGLMAAGLSGSIALERGQYLHLALDLNYAPGTPSAALGSSAGTVFVLNESRRVKFFERNYFDHPAFGVIALVTPVQSARQAGR